MPPQDFEASSNSAGASAGPLAPSERVRQWRQRAQLEEVPEEELLRDVIYLLQGINGQWVQFEESFVMPDGSELEKGQPQGDDRPQKVLKVVFKEDAKVRDGTSRPNPLRCAYIWSCLLLPEDHSADKAPANPPNHRARAAIPAH
mgnify:FL=1